MPGTPPRVRPRPLTLTALAAIGLLACVGETVQAAPPAPPITAVNAAPAPAPAATAPAPTPAPKAPADKKRMYAVTLSSMVVYENGNGYLYGIWRALGTTTDQPARLYWGRGCPEVSDRVYAVLQAGFAQQDRFFLVVDREPDPRQAGAFCVRGVELEAKAGGVPGDVPGGGAPQAAAPK